MKKTVYLLMAASVLALACVKEAKDLESNLSEGSGTTLTDPTAIPATISGTILDTKTSYNEAGEYTWASSDQVRLLVTKDLDTYSPQGIYTYRVKSLSENQKSAVFTSTGSAGDLTAFVDGTWKSAGFAVYPASALDRFTSAESHSYGAPWFTLARNNVSGNASDILMIGVNDESISNFKFYTATAVLKVTVKNIPANAAALKLCTSDKTNCPVDGDFSISKDANGEPQLTFLPTWVSSFNGYQKVDLSGEGAIDSRDFYFNVPAGTYPASTLSILIEDSTGGQILKRTISQEMTLGKNDLLPLTGDYALSYSHTVNAVNPANAPRLSYTIDSKMVRVNISTSDVNNPAEYKDNNRFSNNNGTGSATSGYALTDLTNDSSEKYLQQTGMYYMHYVVCSNTSKPSTLSDANVIAYGSIPFWYISSADVTTFAKEYSFTKTDGTNFWHPGTGSNYSTQMTLAVSDNCTNGNLKMSSLYGKSAAHPLYGCLTASDATSITFTCNGEGEGEQFFSQNGNYFHVAQGADDNPANATEDVVFTIADGPVLTNTAYLMMKYTNTYPATWNQFIYGYQLIFQ